MPKNNLDHGYVADIVTPDQHVLGGGKHVVEILQADHNWTPYLPPDELQDQNSLETMNCTAYGTIRALRILLKQQYGLDLDYSERYVGIAAGTTPAGNSPHVVAECIRTSCGLLPDSLLPFGPDITKWEEYYSPKPLFESLLVEGKKFLDSYDFGHEWVFEPGTALADKQSLLKQALTCSPLGISVFAWAEGGDALYHKVGPDNHWTVLVDYAEGEYWLIFDDYDQTHKKLAWDFDFGSAKRYILKKKIAGAVALPWYAQLLNFVNGLFIPKHSTLIPA